VIDHIVGSMNIILHKNVTKISRKHYFDIAIEEKEKEYRRVFNDLSILSKGFVKYFKEVCKAI